MDRKAEQVKMSLVAFTRGPALAAAALGCHGYRSGGTSLRLLRLRRNLSSAETDQQRQQPQRQEQQRSVIFSDRPASQSYANMTPAQKVVEGTKDAAYGLVVLAGALVTGGLLYALWRELFSSESPAALKSLALERCLADARVQSALGEPIKSHGEGSTRRSRSRLLWEESMDANGVKLVSLKFHLVGQFNRADVYAQGYMSEEKEWRLMVLAVEVLQHPKRVILLEREDKDKVPPSAPLPLGSPTSNY